VTLIKMQVGGWERAGVRENTSLAVPAVVIFLRQEKPTLERKGPGDEGKSPINQLFTQKSA
jgi:hypothetical protein